LFLFTKITLVWMCDTKMLTANEMSHYVNCQYMYTVSQKSMCRYLSEHNSNINCPIIIIFGTVVTETISY